jgi:ubiquinone biosynthesis protein UbiJ
VVLALGRWGSSAPLPPEGNEIGVDSAILALKTVFDPATMKDGELEVELQLGEQPFEVRAGGEGIEIVRGNAEDPDAKLASSPGTLAALLWQGLDLGEAERSGAADVEGDRGKLERFLRLLALRG